MGIAVEFNPDLALRAFGTEGRDLEECFPEKLKEGEAYDFLKKEQRAYWFGGEIPLLETKGGGILSRPFASVRILEATHFLREEEVWTKGRYEVVDVFDVASSDVNFESYRRIE
ncbi:hypothetical protein HN903_00400 [archaeon]|jgi:hypothetical protein|nr:hypothetical protein [archaeon]MBT7128195.1 hypothetical protein [archaeon]